MFVEIHDHLAAQAKLADRYAEIKAEIEGLKLLLEEVKEDIIKTGRDNIVGARNIVTVTLSEPVRFDAATAKSFLAPEQIAACMKTGELVTTIRVKAVKNAKVFS